jgi:hypothetical protein
MPVEHEGQGLIGTPDVRFGGRADFRLDPANVRL